MPPPWTAAGLRGRTRRLARRAAVPRRPARQDPPGASTRGRSMPRSGRGRRHAPPPPGGTTRLRSLCRPIEPGGPRRRRGLAPSHPRRGARGRGRALAPRAGSAVGTRPSGGPPRVHARGAGPAAPVRWSCETAWHRAGGPGARPPSRGHRPPPVRTGSPGRAARRPVSSPGPAHAGPGGRPACRMSTSPPCWNRINDETDQLLRGLDPG